MKKALISVALLLIVIALIPISILVSLQTRYASQVFNQLSQFSGLGMQAESVHYQYPDHFSFKNVSFTHNEVSYVEQLEIWLSPELYTNGRVQIASVLLDGLSLQTGISRSPKTFIPNTVQIHQLAISNLDYADNQLSARGIKFQVKQPQWQRSDQFIPFGEIQFSAQQLYWQGEAFNQPLLDIDYKPQDSTLYGLSLSWRGAKVSGQAEQYPQGWSLVNVTVEGLDLSQQQLTSILAKPWDRFGSQITHINSLDILRSSLALEDYRLINFELSSENLTLPFSLWQQQQGLISFSAESVQDQHNVWVEPRIKLTLDPNTINVEEASAQWQQGNLLFSGTIKPDAIALDQLMVNNVKWAAEQPGEGAWLWQWLENASHVSVERLNIERSQFIQLIRQPYWQLSGLNIDGEKLRLKQEQQLGLWQGKLRATAANASYQDILSSHPLVEMHSDDGLWQLDRLFAPLKQGYVEAYGQLQLNSLSKPWQATLNADGLPMGLLLSQLPLPFDLNAISSIDVSATGLGGDWAMFSHSLTGGVHARLHEAYTPFDEGNILPLQVSEISLSMERGKLTLAPVKLQGPDIEGTIGGASDLTAPEQGGIRYQVKMGCQQLSGDMMSDEHQRANQCPEQSQAAQETTPAQTEEAANAAS
ncbi:TPA: AsmA family protein [Vibrio vulnificus]|uniref:AsmA family protein n=1 Tax=Vibrio vulnificus TaxID=672 RepID=UPI001B81CBCB|nr:AsmA family protein [Vibrio vulnificus]ELK8589654.1 AsmA family protein [Vibrio vulnificus]MCA3966011.1 AsmA family protein [Vibrio vulnificus]MCA4017071.1 AsmA family protein [Vibrio vulnificus]MDS1803436.1 AsmA family protein [Vibrio vulnificus]HBC3370028.1 AsmA family protein [Vibrio vulnificus]